MISVGLFGLLVGSFLNVVIARLPAGESIVRPRSRCSSCGTQLRWHQNIPVVSWFLQRGKCASCAAPIGLQYPFVEIATAAIFAGNVYAYGVTPRAIQGIVLMTILLAVCFTDGKHYLIPDPLSLGGAGAGLALSLLPGPLSPLDAVIGFFFGGALLWVVAIVGTKAFGKDAMGGGDIKLMAMIGAFLGWPGVLLTLFLGSLLGTLVFVPLTLRNRERLVPFGIFLAVGAAVTFVFGDAIIAWYLGGLG